MRYGLSVFLVSAVAATTFFAGCGEEKAAKEFVPLVKTITVGKEASATENVYDGFVCGRYETKMAFQVGGKIIKRNVEAGSAVKVGDILLTIDPKDVIEQSRQNDALVTAAGAKLKLGESNFNRYTELYNEQAIAAAVLEQYKTAYEAALADYQNALAAKSLSANALNYTNLTADADGIIGEINVEEGQVVAAGQNVLTLVRTDESEAEINVPENKLPDATPGKEVKVKFWALPEEIRGVIREVYPVADSASKTYKARISLLNPSPAIRLGMTATVTIPIESAPVVNLPLSALYQTGDDAEVWIVTDENTVRTKKITVCEFNDNFVSVDGLQPGEIVVTAGIHKLRENQKVRVKGETK